MKQTINPKLLEKIQKEIRAKAFEKYAENQGIETQKSEIDATLEALHEVTEIPIEELKKIASEVSQKYISNNNFIKDSFKTDKNITKYDYTYDIFQSNIENDKREFLPHLISFVAVNLSLIILNIITTSFPWAMFPLFGWGIGLVVNFFNKIYYPRRDKKNKITAFKNQTYEILNEYLSMYSVDINSIFPGIYRMLVTNSSMEHIKEYLKITLPDIKEQTNQQLAMQLVSLRDRISVNKKYNQHNKT